MLNYIGLAPSGPLRTKYVGLGITRRGQSLANAGNRRRRARPSPAACALIPLIVSDAVPRRRTADHIVRSSFPTKSFCAFHCWRLIVPSFVYV